MRQFFAHMGGVDHSAARPDTFVFDTPLARSLFLGRNHGFWKITHAEYTDLCARRIGILRKANTHFAVDSVPAEAGVAFIHRHS